MNDDVIKLREALYKAEPFLTYMVAEGEAPRNNTVLIEALNKVREALDMKPHVPVNKTHELDIVSGTYYGDGDVDLKIGEDNKILVSNYVENEDGSATVRLDLGKDAVETLLHIGFSALIRDMSEKLK